MTTPEGILLEYEVKKRTFEGNTDNSKNNDPLTSKYFPSKKYIAIYKIQWDHGGISNMNKVFANKTEAINEMEYIKKYGIRTM